MLIRERIPYKPFAALVAGLMWLPAFAPWAWWPLVPASVALLWWSLQGASARQAGWRGYLFGLGLFGAGVSWLHVSIHIYGYTPLWLAIPMTGLFAAGMALYPALLAWLWCRLGRHSLVFVGLWVLVDWVRGWLLTGFPWLYAGYAMVDTPLASLASLGGIWLVTLVTVATGVLAAQLPLWRRQLPLASVVLAGWLLAPLWQTLSFTEPAGEPIAVALAQGNIPQDMKWLTTQQQATREIYRSLSDDSAPGSLVVWPESAITEFYQDALPFLMEERDRLADDNKRLIAGIPWRTTGERDYRFYNSVSVVGTGSVYHKQKLVPFGEYVPLQDLIRGLIPFFNLPMSSFSPGHPQQPNLAVGDLTIAPFICYEILYPELVARRSGDSELLLTISNDAWFGTSAGPHQHFQMSRLRTIETGRWLVRATNNGITALVNPQGEVVQRLPQFERALLQGTVQPRSGQTPFQHTGSWPWLLLSTVLVAAGWWWRRPAPQ